MGQEVPMPVQSKRRMISQVKQHRREHGRSLVAQLPPMPKTRKECAGVPRPCPFLRCKYNLFSNVKDNGNLNMPHGEDPTAMDRLPHSCALDAADAGPLTLEEVGLLTATTRERVRQVELRALGKLKAYFDDHGIDPSSFVNYLDNVYRKEDSGTQPLMPLNRRLRARPTGFAESDEAMLAELGFDKGEGAWLTKILSAATSERPGR